jgi:transposase-like protein
VIVLAVRWYLRFGLSYRNVEELLTERGIEVDHVTVYGWVQRFTPLVAEAARPCRHAVGDRWQVDETYVVRGLGGLDELNTIASAAAGLPAPRVTLVRSGER